MGSVSGAQAVVIAGAGPGGLGPLFAAANVGRLDALLAGGVTILERGRWIGGGSLNQYAIQSDSAAEAFLDIAVRTEEPRLRALRAHPIAQELAAYGTGSAPLTLAAKFLALASETMCRIVAESERGRILLGVEVVSVAEISDDLWRTRFVHAASGVEHEVVSSSVVIATGAHQPKERLWTEPVAGEPLLPRYAGKLLQSSDVFAHDGVGRITEMLHGRTAPKVTIVGGSTSAGAVAVSLLHRMPKVQFGEGGVTILHRKPLRIFYNSAAEALEDGYTEFTAEDICRLTARVYRLSGFRLDSRELIMKARGIGGRPPEPRLRLQQITEESFAEAHSTLAESDLVIAAMGYRPRVCRVQHASGEIALHKPSGDRWAMVDQQCRLMREDGTGIDGLFGIGLAVGPAASHELGGETGFRGQVNSLWLWQHTLGLRIADGVAERMHASKSVKGNAPKGQGSQPLSLPVIRPVPPKLSRHALELAEIEQSGVYSNYGPVNTRLEDELRESLFGEGACLTVCNATIGLMMAMREVVGEHHGTHHGERRYALMPSFTFAATAQAALWCGLTPLLCDMDRETWLPCAASEERLLQQYAGQVAVVVPYATLGNSLDLVRYRRLADTYSVPVVIDAAASLGSLDEAGKQFGSGFAWPVVFSMHATKPFSVGEGGLIYCADPDRLARLRTMGSFGFGAPRTATMLGINSKMPEVTALTALLELRRFPEVVRHREALAQAYRQGWSKGEELRPQKQMGLRQSRAFESVLLPRSLAPVRAKVADGLKVLGIGSGTYFSPHLAEQPYLREHSIAGSLPVTADVAGRILSLPLLDTMTVEDVETVVRSLREVTEHAGQSLASEFKKPPVRLEMMPHAVESGSSAAAAI